MRFWQRLWRKLRFVIKRNDLLVREAREINLNRIRFAVKIIVPTHLGIIYLLSKGSQMGSNRLWTSSLMFANAVTALGELIFWFYLSHLDSKNVTAWQSRLYMGLTLFFVAIGGIGVTLVEQLVIPGVVPFTIMSCLIGTLLIIRPRVAILFHVMVYFAFVIALNVVGFAPQVVLINKVGAFFSSGLGLTLSTLGWCNFYKIAQQKGRAREQQKELEKMAYHDFLTGLPNRRFLDEVVKKDLALMKRGGHRSSLMVLDIDNFKDINDLYGHSVGDQVLKELGTLLSKNIRDTDTVARVGGEEFVILLANTSPGDSGAVAEKLRLMIERHVFVQERHSLRITVSFGVSSLSHKDKGLSYYERADQALYEAKARGKNRVGMYPYDDAG